MKVSTGWSWISQSTNKKTGNIPTAYIGHSSKEAKATCSGCPLLEGIPRASGGKLRCYAWQGTSKLGFGSMSLAATGGKSAKDMAGTPALEPGGRYSIDYAISHRHPRARCARLGALGDPSRVRRHIFKSGVKLLRAAGLAVLGYTHFWRGERRNQGLRTDLMASCDTVAQADDALARGWIPAAIVDYDPGPGVSIVLTPGGARLLVCPAMRRSSTTCNDCRMCDPQHAVWQAGKIHGIAFPDHSSGGPARAKK